MLLIRVTLSQPCQPTHIFWASVVEGKGLSCWEPHRHHSKSFSYLTSLRVACSALGLSSQKWRLRDPSPEWDRRRHKWVILVVHRGRMPRLRCEVSVGFLEEGITELSPEGYEGDLEFESCEQPTVILCRASW